MISTDLLTKLGDSVGLVLVFKHSPFCGASARAMGEVEAFARDHDEIPVRVVDVIRERPLSAQLAEELGIRHASPQAILLRDGRPIWRKHFAISRRALERAIA